MCAILVLGKISHHKRRFHEGGSHEGSFGRKSRMSPPSRCKTCPHCWKDYSLKKIASVKQFITSNNALNTYKSFIFESNAPESKALGPWPGPGPSAAMFTSASAKYEYASGVIHRQHRTVSLGGCAPELSV